MAEFVDVMKQYNRMFEAHKKGVSIPVEASYETAVKQPDFFEEVVMSWAAEHPEPVYPTWKEWLEEQRVVVHFDSVDKHGIKVKWELTNKSNCHIPADIAEKLGIEPKEG